MTIGAGVLAVLAATSSGPSVHIEVRGDRSVALLARSIEAREARGLRPVQVDVDVATVCHAPCDRQVDVSAGAGFFIAARGVMPSREFDLPPQGEVTLKVRPGRRGSFIAGWVLAGLGGAGVLAGATTLTFADDDPDRQRTGAIVLGSGAVALVTGVVLIATGRTRVALVDAAR